MNADKRKFDVVQTLEGKSPLEVFRNYQQALTAAGLQVRLLCEKIAGTSIELGHTATIPSNP